MATDNLFNPTNYYYGFLVLLLLASLTVIGVGSSKHKPCPETEKSQGIKCISEEGKKFMLYGAIAFAIVFILIVVSILGNDPVLRWFKGLYPKTPIGYVKRPRVPDVRYDFDDYDQYN